jgi:hypothetical protein
MTSLVSSVDGPREGEGEDRASRCWIDDAVCASGASTLILNRD